MLASEGFIRACRWNAQGHRQCSPLSVLILSCSSVTFSPPPPPSPRLHLQPSTHSRWWPSPHHGRTTAAALLYSSELNINEFPRRCMNHSFFMMSLTTMQASSKQTGQTECFVNPADVHMHLQTPASIFSPPAQLAWWETSGNTQWSCHRQENGGGEMLQWPSRIRRLGGGWGLLWQITLSKRVSQRRFTSVSSSERFFFLFAFQKTPCHSATSDRLLANKIYTAKLGEEYKQLPLIV